MSFKENISDQAKHTAHAASEAFTEASKLAGSVASVAYEAGKDLFNNVAEQTKEVAQAVADAMDVATDKASDAIEAGKEKAGDLLEKGKDINSQNTYAIFLFHLHFLIILRYQRLCSRKGTAIKRGCL